MDQLDVQLKDNGMYRDVPQHMNNTQHASETTSNDADKGTRGTKSMRGNNAGNTQLNNVSQDECRTHAHGATIQCAEQSES